MSDTYLRIIPDDPNWVPAAESAIAVTNLMSAFVPGSEVTTRYTDEVEFVDQGENFERVLCSNCGTDLTDSWSSVMDTARKTSFSDLGFETPCCHTQGNLSTLVYEWPAGFARFVVEVSGLNAGRFLDQSQIQSVAKSLGYPVRQILARY